MILTKKIKHYQKIYRRFGIRAIIFLLKSKFKLERKSNVRIKGISNGVFLSNFNVDVMTLFQIFFAKEYEIKKSFSAQLIIDCGANIGLSAVYFANEYPEAKIYAIEPDIHNFSFLKKNTEHYTNVICLNQAIWSHKIRMEVVDIGHGGWALQTRETRSDFGIESITLEEIMEMANATNIDLLKIDVEGAEKELFSRNYENWLSKTRFLAIELHDFLEPGISDVFFNAIKNYSYDDHSRGENFICEFTGLEND